MATKKAASESAPERIIAYKGFAADLSCAPAGVKFQYEIGKTYKSDAKVVRCGAGGFHSCEHPRDVFRYYAPAGNRFAEVEASGEIARDGSDTKIASAEITIKAELKIPDLVARAIKWVTERATQEEGAHATGTSGGSSATGYRGASSATGYRGASMTTGTECSSSATGEHGIAAGFGRDNRVLAGKTGALVLVYRDPADDGAIKHVFASKVGENGIKPDVWYVLNAEGKPEEIAS